MAKYLITFSEKGIALGGKPLEEQLQEEIDNNLLRLRSQANQAEGDEKAKIVELIGKVEDRIRKNAKDKRGIEKDVLDGILAAKAKGEAKAADMFSCLDLADRIQNAEDSIELDEDDRKLLQGAYEKATKQDAWFIHLRGLMRQIARPELVEEKKEDAKAEATKPA